MKSILYLVIISKSPNYKCKCIKFSRKITRFINMEQASDYYMQVIQRKPFNRKFENKRIKLCKEY